MRGLPESVGALRERPFRLLWLGQTTSAVGDSMTSVALVFAVLALGSATDLGIVFAGYTASHAIFILAGGVWADRLERRIVMLTCDLVRAAAQAFVAVALIAGFAEVWHLFVVAIVVGAAASFFGPASTGLIPQTVSASRLQEANALMGLARNGSSILGPALAGIVVAVVGAGWVFAFDAATFVASAYFLARLRVARHARIEARPFFSDLAEGWREVRSRDWLWASLLGFGIGNLAWGAQGILGPLVAENELGGAAAWGFISASFGVGGLLGGLILLTWRPSRLLLVSTTITFVMGVHIALYAVAPPVVLLMASAVATSVAIVISNTLWETSMQQHIPQHAISRVSSYDWAVSLIFMPIGFVFWGPLADWIGVDETLLLAAGASVAAHALVLLAPGIWTLRRLDDPPEPALVAEALTPVP